jgi:peptidoglycan/xylan/chitin deacetylase (PgdA/CDA1 family)
VVEQLRRDQQFLMRNYGVDARPVVDAVAAELGYTVPTLWSGSLEDQNVIGEGDIVKMAHKYFNPQAIVIGHLNHLPVTHVYGQLVDVIRSRNLQTVTLDDLFAKPEQV